MVRKSTIVILVGVVFLFIPIPPIATIAGILTILLGVGLRRFGSS
jgi:xanthosine utilization system XapX-like protein